MKDKNLMITSIEAETSIWQNKNQFIIKTLNKMGIEGMYFNILKAIYDNPTANIILNDEELKSFLLRSRTRQENP